LPNATGDVALIGSDTQTERSADGSLRIITKVNWCLTRAPGTSCDSNRGETCKPFDAAWRATLAGGSDQMEYGLSGTWCSDGTNVRLGSMPTTYGSVLTPPWLLALGTVFDLHFEYTNRNPLPMVERDPSDGSLTLTADGTFTFCGQAIPIGDLGVLGLQQLGAVEALASALEHAPAPARKKIAALLAAAVTKFFALTGRTDPTKGEKEAFEALLAELFEGGAALIPGPDLTPCVRAWEPQIQVRLHGNGRAEAQLTYDTSLFTAYPSVTVGVVIPAP
jgi:hypothetical protein